MKLGAAYNVFDGVEHLEASIKSIRENVDFICVVFQGTSNFGNTLDVESFLSFSFLIEKKLIDFTYYYEPIKNTSAGVNEIKKRNIGKEVCEKHGCTHFMTIDADECYIPSQFKEAKEYILKENLDSSACKMLTYYKESNVVLWPPEEYYVPFIYKLDSREFKQNTYWPVPADPTRKLDPKFIHLFERNELQMHHFSYVRNNIRQKLENSSAVVNWRNRVDQIVSYYDKWVYPMPALLGGSKEKYWDVMRVSKLF